MTDDWILRWQAAEAQWVNDRAVLIDLPAVAVDAMVHGWDSPSLRLLAGMSRHDDVRDVRDVRDVFLAAVSELGRDLPGSNDGGRFYSAQIAYGTLSPIQGARLICRLGYDFTGATQDFVMTFVGLEDEAKGRWGRTPSEVQDAIMQAAIEVLRSPAHE